MNLKIRVEQLEAAQPEPEGRWTVPIGVFYGEDLPLVWVTGIQTLDDFYGQGLPESRNVHSSAHLDINSEVLSL